MSRWPATGPTGSVEHYVATLGRALPGPRRLRRELLEELRTGLLDAAEAHRRAGLPADEAERRAVSESGNVREIAEDFRAELAAVQGRRAAMVLALTMLAGVVAWDVVWNFAPHGPAPPIVVTLAGVVDWAGLAGGLSALAAIALLVFGARRRQAVRPILAGMVVVTGLSIAMVMGGSVVMNLADVWRTFEVVQGSRAVAVVSVLSLAMFVAQLWALWRTIRVTFTSTPLPADELVPV